MRKFSVPLHTVASASITVELPGDVLDRLATELGYVDADGAPQPERLTVEDLEEEILNRAYDNTPDICAQCSGWGRSDGVSLELGDEWEVSVSREGDADHTAITEETPT